jgi:hypothetical protein
MPSAFRVAQVASVAAAALLAGVLVASPGTTRLALAAAAAVITAVVAIRKPHLALYLLGFWLVSLGTVRRLSTGLVGPATTADPFLAVAPFAFVLLAVVAVHGGALRERSVLTNAVLGLTFVLAVSALNPAQGGLAVGLTGAASIVVPMLAFLVGRSLVPDHSFRRVLVVIVSLSLPAAAYGLYQVFVRFPAWDQRWIEQGGYAALNVGGIIRPFGSFASGQEFGVYAALGLVLLVAFAHGGRWLWALPPLALAAAAVWYESSRTIVVLVLAALAVMGAARMGWSLRRAVVVAAMVLVAIPWGVGRLAPARFDDPDRQLRDHQVDGLVDPFGERSSLTGHLELVVGGVRSAFSNPVGRGVGAVTGAAAQFGGSGANTEVDVSNAAVAGGILGLIGYLTVALVGFSKVYRLATLRRDSLAYAALGILVVTGFQWLNGGLYAVAYLPWLAMGWADVTVLRLREITDPTRLVDRVSDEGVLV